MGVPVTRGPGANRRLRSAAAMLVLLVAGCSNEPHFGVVTSAATVGDYITSSCSTSVVLELSRQVAEEVDCLMPGQLVRFEEQGGIRFNGAAVLPYMDEEARTDLYAATTGARTLEINSAFRSVVQQFLLREWYEQGRCGISAAALPGQSNHEGGRALDVDNWYDWVGDLANHGWAHDVPGDDVHFDHLASPDIRGADVLAFQRLWNRNHPTDTISEDGDYGAMTEARLRQAPAEGFATGASCVDTDRALDVVAVTGPEVIAPGERGHFAVTLRNIGIVGWTGEVALVTASGDASALHDPQSWDSPTQVMTLGADVAPEDELELEIVVLGPPVEEVTPIGERFTLYDGDSRFGAIPIGVTVDPDDDPDHEDNSTAVGGCAAAGGGSGGMLVLVGLGLMVRRRRAMLAA